MNLYRNETYDAKRKAQRADRDALAVALREAIRFIEVQQAYKGAMTAAEVEVAIIANKDMSAVSIGANSCNTLAWFNFHKAREALAKHGGSNG